MTVSPVQILQAQAQGLINVTGLAAACDKYSFPFFYGCTIMAKETRGKNIFGHDVGGIFTGPSNVNVEVTEANYAEFLRKLAAGERSNGVGPLQLTYRGYHIGPLSIGARGLKCWISADNILYGVEILAKSYQANLARGMTPEAAFWTTAKAYNGNASYADDAAVKARTWAATVGTSDMEVEPVPTERIPFRGFLTCKCVVESLPLVEEEMLLRGLIKESIDVYQGGYRDDVGASAGTHARGFNIDVGQYNPAQIDIWRLHGYNMQHRTRAQGFDQEHGHGGPWGCPHGSPAALDQIAQWRLRQNGLISHGPVQGRWPVKDYRDAMVERRKIIMTLAQDIGKAVAAELVKAAPALAKALLSADDIITAGRTEPDATNKAWAAKTFITNDFNTLDDLRDDAKAIRAAIEKLAAKPGP